MTRNTMRVQEGPKHWPSIQRTSTSVDLNPFGTLLRYRSSLYSVKTNTTTWGQWQPEHRTARQTRLKDQYANIWCRYHPCILEGDHRDLISYTINDQSNRWCGCAETDMSPANCWLSARTMKSRWRYIPRALKAKISDIVIPNDTKTSKHQCQ